VFEIINSHSTRCPGSPACLNGWYAASQHHHLILLQLPRWRHPLAITPIQIPLHILWSGCMLNLLLQILPWRQRQYS
jgi:hypothetical protein